MSINIPFRLRYLRTAAATVLVAVSACSWQVKAEELEPLRRPADKATENAGSGDDRSGTNTPQDDTNPPQADRDTDGLFANE